jgi:hypothetical protein
MITDGKKVMTGSTMPHSSLDYKTPDDFVKSRLIEAGKLTV